MELWDAYDRHGQRTNETLIRGQNIPDDRYHLVVECLVQHRDSSILFMKRHPDKPAFPNHYEATAGGSALQGESAAEAILREVYEETGIHLKPEQLSDNYSFRNDEHHCLFECYTATVSIPKDCVQLQTEETVDFIWVPVEELKQFFSENLVIPRHQKRIEEIFTR